jgi:hypothetical protein
MGTAGEVLKNTFCIVNYFRIYLESEWLFDQAGDTKNENGFRRTAF